MIEGNSEYGSTSFDDEASIRPNEWEVSSLFQLSFRQHSLKLNQSSCLNTHYSSSPAQTTCPYSLMSRILHSTTLLSSCRCLGAVLSDTFLSPEFMCFSQPHGPITVTHYYHIIPARRRIHAAPCFFDQHLSRLAKLLWSNVLLSIVLACGLHALPPRL